MTNKELIQQKLAEARQGFALITFEAKCYEPRKVDRKATVKAAADHGVTAKDVKLVKDTVLDARVARIKTILNQARNFHYKATRPWAGRRVGIIRGQDLIPYAQTMNSFKKEFEAAVESAAEVWPIIVAEQADRLNGLFRIEDYPTVEQFKSKYRLRYYTDTLPGGRDWLLDAPEATVDELAGTFEEQQDQRLGDLKTSVLEETKKVLKNAHNVLRKGNPQSIRNALVTNLRKQADWLRDLNIDQDQDVLKIVKLIEEDIVKHGADELRENDAVLNRAIRGARLAVRTAEQAVGQ